ncbi:hypothetical protein ACWD4T_31680 [Streptomyces umbrinus]
MTSLAQLRRTALSLPGTAERSTASGTKSFTVRDKRFASLGKDDYVQLHLPTADADEVLAAHPTAEPLTPGATPIGVRLPIGDINGQQLNHWVRRAWLAHAPGRLAAQVQVADTAAAGEVGDLPRAIGNPATRALANVGITTLAQVAEMSEAELLAMHGVGPKAVRLLGEALGAAGHRPKG